MAPSTSQFPAEPPVNTLEATLTQLAKRQGLLPQVVLDTLSLGPSAKVATFSFEPRHGDSLYKTEKPPFSVPVATEKI